MLQVQSLVHAPMVKWTVSQEKSINREYPYETLDDEKADQYVVRTYLQFLWLPESIMPLQLLVPALRRVEHASFPSPSTSDGPHALHELLEPLLQSVRSCTNKYHTELPQILANNGGADEAEENMMWFALNHEQIDQGEDTLLNETAIQPEDRVLLEDKWRVRWLERLEAREVQIQILLYMLKLSLPGVCLPLRPVMPFVNNSPNGKKRKHDKMQKMIVPSAEERVESFMDKLSMWQLVNAMDLDSADQTSSGRQPSPDKRDWMQRFCEEIVEPLFKDTVPEMCKLLRSKVFPHSPFSDDASDSLSRSPSPEVVPDRASVAGASNPLSESKMSAGPTTKSKVASPSAPSHSRKKESTDTRSRSRSLSVSLAHEADTRRVQSRASIKRTFSREVSMSRAFKGKTLHDKTRERPQTAGKAQKIANEISSLRVDPLEAGKDSRRGITLVADTPVKPKAKNLSRMPGPPVPLFQPFGGSSALTEAAEDDEEELDNLDNSDTSAPYTPTKKRQRVG